MTTRTQITLDREMQRRARSRAAQLNISLAEYVRRPVARDLSGDQETTDPSVVFALGNSGGSDFARDKDPIIVEGVAHKVARRGSQR
jgi:hypothetical protein